jgi:hypothetical protein
MEGIRMTATKVSPQVRWQEISEVMLLLHGDILNLKELIGTKHEKVALELIENYTAAIGYLRKARDLMDK